MEHPFEHLVGKWVLLHAKYHWRGILREVCGLHLILDKVDMVFRIDAEKVRQGEPGPVSCGDGVVLHSDWVEAIVPGDNCRWIEAHKNQVEGVSKRRTKPS